MRALVYTGPEAMEMREVAQPEPGPGQALVKVEKVGICGSDMHAFLGHDERRVPPLSLGHEAAGVVIGGARDGQRVAVNPLMACGTCAACASGRVHICANRKLVSIPPFEGAFAEYVLAREETLVSVPADFPFKKAALAEPLAVCWHAAKLGMRVLDGPLERVLVIGGGPIGLGVSLCMKALCDEVEVVISEPVGLRREYLGGLGEAAVAPEAVLGAFDLVVDAVGYGPTREAACAAVRPGGTIVHLGLGSATGGVDVRRLTLQEIAFVGSYCYTPGEFSETVEAMLDGRLGALDWFEERPLDAGQGAFEDIRAGVVAAPKIILVT